MVKCIGSQNCHIIDRMTMHPFRPDMFLYLRLYFKLGIEKKIVL